MKEATVVGTEHVDPVCGMTVDPEEAAGRSEFRGQTIHRPPRGAGSRVIMGVSDCPIRRAGRPPGPRRN